MNNDAKTQISLKVTIFTYMKNVSKIIKNQELNLQEKYIIVFKIPSLRLYLRKEMHVYT